MKKLLPILALLSAPVFAQSSLTIYGVIDQGVGKPIGTSDKQVMDGAGPGIGGSRIGFRGTEALGNDLSAVFSFEHRFTPDTGEDASPGKAIFWHGNSWVGLRHARYGTLTLGRHLSPAFIVQNQFDPFLGTTIATLRTTGIIPTVTIIRFPNSVNYNVPVGKFTARALIAEALPGGKRPYSLAGNYDDGKLYAGLTYENQSPINDYVASAGVRYNFGRFTASVAASTAKNIADQTVRAFLVGGTVPLNLTNTIRAGWAHNKNSTTDLKTHKVGVGLQHRLSTRTYLYADVAKQRTSPVRQVESFGYDLGINHSF